MSDNEIECLGSVPPQLPPPTTTPVAGITLTVTAGDEPNRTLRFLNYPATREITIGRASSSSPRKIGGLHASFRCPVISRKHASIVFMDSGFVSITDLRSHHGTYVRKADSPSGRALLPNLAFQLNNGDFVTFGKKVAKDDGWVDPVTVEVRFMNQQDYARDDSTPAAAQSSIGLSHSNSGRFGLTMGDNIYSSSSSDGEYSDEDDDAPEELPIARGPSLLDRLSESVELPPMRSTLAKFLPSYSHRPSPSPELPDFSVAEMFHEYARAASPFIVGAYPASEDDREDIGRAPTTWEPANMAPWRWDEPKTTIGELQREEEESMDMDSNSGAEAAHVEPAAQPAQVSHNIVQIDVAPVVEEPMGNVRVDALEARLTAFDDAIVNLRSTALRDHLEARKTHAADISKLDALGTRTDELSTSLEQLRERMDEDDWAQYEDLSGDITDVRHQVEQLDDLVNDLRGDLDGTDDTAHDLRMRVEVLEGMRIKAEDESQTAREAEAQKVQALVTEVCMLRNDFKHALEELATERARIQTERETAEVERAAAEAERAAAEVERVAAHVERVAAQAERERTPPRTLKRKHDDIEDEGESEGELTRALVHVQSHKRARLTAERVAGSIARGTAYAAVGAVAAWSALAFA